LEPKKYRRLSIKEWNKDLPPQIRGNISKIKENLNALSNKKVIVSQ
jgi:hypothetical protein